MASSQHTPDTSDEQRNYKLVLYRSEDFKEVRSVDVSLRNMYIFASSLLLLLSILIFALMSYTPLKRLIPGYGSMEANPKFLELVQGVNELSDEVDAQIVYLGALSNVINSGVTGSEAGGLPGREASTSATSVNVSNQVSNQRSAPVAEQAEIIASTDKDYYSALSQDKVVKPVLGIVSSSFDPQIKHFGVDILAPAETPIMAIMDGIVFSSGWDLETGYSLAIQHDNNVLSFYKHNSQLLKEKGTFVRAGEAVAIIGNTGTLSSGPHLHFELWHNGQPINPQDVFKF